MARVNHKRVKQLLNEKRSKITDRQFFTSRILAGHFEDMAMAQTRRYKYNRRVHVGIHWEPKDGNVACTNNLSVLINAGHKLVTKNRTRAERYEIVCGLFAHELGHCLHTDFLAEQTYDNYLSRNRWYPDPPVFKLPLDAANERALWDYVKLDPKNNEMLRYIAHNINNVLEDGYVESRILSQFPGTLGTCLEALREQQLASIPTVTQLIEHEEDGSGHIFESILQLILSYVKYGEIKYGEEPLSDERVQVVFKLIKELDNAIINPSGKERLKVVNLIMVRCWKYIEDFMEVCKKRQEDAAASGAGTTLAQTLSEVLQSIAGGSSAGEGSSTPVPEAGTSCSASNPEKRAKTGAQAKESESGEKPEDKEAESQTESEGENHAAAQSQSGGTPECGEVSPGDSDAASGGKQDVASEETGRIPYQRTERVSAEHGGTVERNDSYERERYDHAADDIERLLDKMAEKAACTQLENERTRELNDVAQSISYGDVHAGVSIRVNRIADVDEQLVDQYDAISGPLLTISKQLQKSLIQQLKDKQRGGKQTGLMMGRRLDAHALCRNDGKVFYKNALPNEIPEMAVGLLLDESGSMCSCDRCTYARASAIILYDFCKSLRIPVMVYGHSTGGGGVELYSYAEFESIDNNDKYRMVDIAARGSNRDGAALRFVAEQLVKRPEEVKILILVSDGQPAAPGYYGSAAEEDLRGIKQEYRRKGILFIAAAIGDDKQNIERIYGDAFMDITDLNQLPVKLTVAVKRHMRV
jgi:cobalamin biosynthesis protein CobT